MTAFHENREVSSSHISWLGYMLSGVTDLPDLFTPDVAAVIMGNLIIEAPLEIGHMASTRNRVYIQTFGTNGALRRIEIWSAPVNF